MKSRKKKWLLILGITVVVFTIFAALNPSEKQHKEFMAACYINFENPNYSTLSPAEQEVIYRDVYGTQVEKLTYHNYIIFSTTTEPAFIGSCTVSIGYCGKVHTTVHFPGLK